MHTARFTLHAADLAEVMASMRCWPDKHHTQPLVLSARTLVTAGW